MLFRDPAISSGPFDKPKSPEGEGLQTSAFSINEGHVNNTAYLDIRDSKETHPLSDEALDFMMTGKSGDAVYTQGDLKKIAERAWVDIEYNPDGTSTAAI